MNIGHNSLEELRQSEEWQRCIRLLGDDLMNTVWDLRKDAFKLEAAHILLIQQLGDEYRNCVFAELVRRAVYEQTGKEVA